MIEFAWPWVFYLAPLPLLVYWLVPAVQRQEAALKVPFLAQLQSLGNEPQQRRRLALNQAWGQKLLALLIWLLLLSAAAKPELLGAQISLPATGRDLMLAVDLSGSMEIQDLKLNNQPVTRLRIVKQVLGDFIERRQGDRLGLILFGSQAYLQAPLTFDLQTVKGFLLEAQLRMAGENTAIGDAIGLAVKRLQSQPQRNSNSRVLILLTDGANTAGEVAPIQAAKLAALEGIKIYSIGVGADEMLTQGLFGSGFGARRVNPSADLDEGTLKEIARLTGGRYFRARDAEELTQIYQLLDELEAVQQEAETFRPQQTLFYYPLALALLLSALLALWQIDWQQLMARGSKSGNQSPTTAKPTTGIAEALSKASLTAHQQRPK